MNIIIQLLCITFSFIYGFFINFGWYFTNKGCAKNLLWSLMLSLLFSFDIVVFYIIIIYKINGGIFHLYFILLIFLGMILSNVIVKQLKKSSRLSGIWYTYFNNR